MNSSKSANLARTSRSKRMLATSRADVLLAVDQAYFGLLRSQAVLTVAQETVKEPPTRLRSSDRLKKTKLSRDSM